jgi:hypothetical protein
MRDRSASTFDELVVLGAAGLDEARCGALAAAGPRDWRDGGDALVEAVAGSRLVGALVTALERGLVVLGDSQLQQLHAAHVTALSSCLRLEERLCDVAETLAAGGIGDLRVVKGPAICHLDEDDPSARTFGDLDLLVRGEDLDRAVAVLGEAGAVRPYAERRAGFDGRFAKSVTLTYPDGIEIDLHRTICDGVHAIRLPVDRLWQSPVRFELAGVGFAAMDPTARVLHAAYHAVLGSPVPAPMSRRDLVGYLVRTDHDVAPVVAEAERWGGVAVLHEAVAIVRVLPGAGLRGWAAWADSTEVTPTELAIVAAQRRDGSSYGRSRLRAVAEMDRWRDRYDYARGVLVPSRRHLADRGLNRWSMLGQLVRPARAARPDPKGPAPRRRRST